MNAVIMQFFFSSSFYFLPPRPQRLKYIPPYSTLKYFQHLLLYWR